MISLILPSYVIDEEVYGYQKKCLEAIKANTPRDLFQFIVIDNGSKFGSDEMKEVADIYIRKDYPMGYARAVNCGWSLADHDYVAVINNDLFVQKGWLEQLLADYKTTVGGILAPYDHETTNQGVQYDKHWYSLFLTHKDVLSKVGYFDESINYRYHDQDYSIRVKMAGFEVMRTPNVIVSHINSATYNKMEQKQNENAEYQIMINRYGHSMFEDWVRHYGKT